MPHHDCISALSNISYGTRYRTWRHEATSHLSMSLYDIGYDMSEGVSTLSATGPAASFCLE